MVICKFFLQGNCRFGENCKFEHQLNDGRQQHSSIIRQQNFGGASTNTTNIDANTLIRAVTNDMLAAEKGGQWLLSCYAPFKEKPNFPGFEEQSFEEVRWGYYEAQRSGTVDQYRQQLQMALQGAAVKIRSLQNPSPDAINTIKTIYNSSQQSSASSVFGNAVGFNNPTANTFGQANYGSANVFAQSNQQQTSSPGKSIFAVANQKLFGGMQQQPNSNSVFGGNNQTGNLNGQSIFSNASAQQGSNFGTSAPFGQSFVNPFVAQPNQQAAPPFGVQQQQPAPPAFNGQTFNTQQNPPFGMQQQNSAPLFSSQQNPSLPFNAQQQAGNLEYNANQQFGLPFVGAQPTTNMPFMHSQTGAFPAQQQQANVPFGATQEVAAPPFGQTSIIFSGNTNSAQSLGTQSYSSSNTTVFAGAGMGSMKEEGIYSKLEDLSESDIKAYESENFEFGKIPEKPPTIQMCF